MSLPKVIVTNGPATEGVSSSPREQLSNQIAHISQLQRKTLQVHVHCTLRNIYMKDL